MTKKTTFSTIAVVLFCGLSFVSCSTTPTDTANSEACANARQKIAAGETLTPEEQSCVNRAISSYQPEASESTIVPKNQVGMPGSAVGTGRAY